MWHLLKLLDMIARITGNILLYLKQGIVMGIMAVHGGIMGAFKTQHYTAVACRDGMVTLSRGL